MNENIENKDNMQEAQEEQPVERQNDAVQEERVNANEQSGNDDDETIEEFIFSANQRIRKMLWLEFGMGLVTVMVAIAAIGWFLCGEYWKGFNNCLWIFIACIFWRMQIIFKRTVKLTVLLMENTMYYKKKCDRLIKIKQIYEKIEANSQKIINCQDRQIEILKQNQKE